MLFSRNSWDVEDHWITLHGVLRGGDSVPDLIKAASDGVVKVRLAALLALGKHAVTDSTDKRAMPVMLERLADTDFGVRTVASAALGISGWIDATVDPCFRNRTIAALQALADPNVEPNEGTRAKAAASAKTLLELGMLDTKFLPISEKCGIVRPTDPPDVGPLVDPRARVGMTTGQKVAVGLAAALTLGAISYAVLAGATPPAPARRARRRRA